MSDPRKWLGLLRWSSKYHDGTHPSEFRPMSEEDMKWLQEVMDTVVIDEVQRMTQILAILAGNAPHDVYQTPEEEREEYTTSELVEYKLELMEELIDIVSQIDRATDFIKVDGLEVMTRLLSSEHSETVTNDIRAKAASIIGTVVQNNPEGQKKAKEKGIFQALSEALQDDSIQVRRGALRAMSSLIRGDTDAEGNFLSEAYNGLDILRRCVSATPADENLVRRAIFIMRFLMSAPSPVGARNAETLYSAGLILPKLGELIGNESVDLRETAILALTGAVLSSDSTRLNMVQHPCGLQQTIKERLSLLQERVQKKKANGTVGSDDVDENVKEEVRLLLELNYYLARGKQTVTENEKQEMKSSGDKGPIFLLKE